MENATTVIREARILEFYADWIWPIHRKFCINFLSKRCQSCFLSEQYTSIKNGICSECRENSEPKLEQVTKSELKKLSSELDQILKEASQSSDRHYDVLVLFSGGKDSTYLLDYLQKSYPELRLLAFTVDNTFMSPVALRNISLLVNQMGVEHVVFRPEKKLMEKMFRYAFLNLNNRGCAGTVDHCDGDFLFDSARNFAADHNIPLILSGLSRTQVGHVLDLDHFETSDEFEASNRTHVATLKLSDIFSAEEISNYWWQGAERSEQQRARVIFPFYCWDPSEEYIKSEVVRLKLVPPGSQSPLITNNRLIPLMGIVDNCQLGYCSFETEFAKMVRQGKAERKQWLYRFELLEYAAKTGKFLGSAVHQALERLSLTKAELGIPE